MAGLLAACEGDDDDDEPEQATATRAAESAGTEPSAPATPALSATPTESTASSPTSASTPDAASGSETRTFIDVYGNPIEVPANPMRIVAIHDNNGGAQLLSLGAPVIGLPTRGGEIDPALGEIFDISGIAAVGETYEPDIEAILALEPDLIVGEGYAGQGMDRFMGAGIHESLLEIAPVVYIDTFRSVEDVMSDFAELLGDDYIGLMDEQKVEFDTLVADIEAILGDDWANVTAAYVSKHATAGTLQSAGPTGSTFTDILNRVGVSWVPLVIAAGSPENGGYLGEISNERMNEFESDLLIADAYYDQTILEDPLFLSLQVVEQEQVIVAELSDGNFWGTHFPIYMRAAQFLLDELNAIQPMNTDIVGEA
jgi:iron complex transport system substrate-binding protein